MSDLLPNPVKHEQVNETVKNDHAPSWYAKYLWPLEREYGSMVNVPEGEPILVELRHEMNTLAAAKPITNSDYMAGLPLWITSPVTGIKQRNRDLIWKLHKQGKDNREIARIFDTRTDHIRQTVEKEADKRGDHFDYEKQLMRVLLAQGKNVEQIAAACGSAINKTYRLTHRLKTEVEK